MSLRDPLPATLDTRSARAWAEMDNRVRRNEHVSLEGLEWKNLPFHGGWADWSEAEWGKCAYSKDGNGIVRLKGLASNTAAYAYNAESAWICVLPEGYRPGKPSMHLMGYHTGESGIARCDVRPGGEVVLVEDFAKGNTGVANGWHVLNEVWFVAGA